MLPNPQSKESGIALVITLILLSVITFMAVTFLVVSRHETGQVDQMTSQTYAKNAADAGLQQAMAQLAANMQANSANSLLMGLMVSTNLWNGTNFVTSVSSITNVSYQGITSQGDLLTMLNNLLILPRPPVFVPRNNNPTNLDFRFFLNLNRNVDAQGNPQYDPTGVVQVYDTNGAPVIGLFTNVIGDPEWIGVLNHPELRHSPSNFFVARYAFVALPIGNSLDINYIHNQAKQFSQLQKGRENDAYLRDQGVGTWEINLAAFLHSLSGSFWPYNNYTPLALANPNPGDAFNDAAAIVQYRYMTNYANVSPFYNYYTSGANIFKNDFIDGYSIGPVMTGLNGFSADPDLPAYQFKFAWSGSENPARFFKLGDFFGAIPFNRADGVTNGFYSAGNSKGTSDRYSFYTMLNQMSFGSTSEPALPPVLSTNANYMSVYGNSPRMNLNYVNVNGTNATNFLLYSPVEFFTNAADRMLRAYFPNPIGTTLSNGVPVPVYLCVTNIPIYPTNYYTPAVHRILQLAANMYDSLNTNRVYDTLTPNGPFFPSVFQPYFVRQGASNFYINGYVEASNVNTYISFPPYDLRNPATYAKLPQGRNIINVYGIPYIIGARAGWPSFNKFASLPMIQMQRAMEIVRDSSAYPSKTWKFYVRYTLSVSNCMGIECWYPSSNSYFMRPVHIYSANESDMWVTNDSGMPPRHISVPPTLIPTNFNPNFAFSRWPGTPKITSGTGFSPYSFKVVFSNCVAVVSNEYLQISPPRLIAQTNTSIPFEPVNNYFMPKWGVSFTNRVRLIMVDDQTGRIVDYVMLGGMGGVAGPDEYIDVNGQLNNYVSNLFKGDPNKMFWSSNVVSSSNSIPLGFSDQIAYAENGSPDPRIWRNAPGDNNVPLAQGNFRTFMGPNYTTNIAQVPMELYSSFVMQPSTWAANDPLVHYTTGDLADGIDTPSPNDVAAQPFVDPNWIPFGFVKSKRYQPWGVTNSALASVAVNQNFKDPNANTADTWLFPTNKFPNIGWLGRVHRGTPWQTVFLKSGGTNDATTWSNWTGDSVLLVSSNYTPLAMLTNTAGYTFMNDSSFSLPPSDYLLMDLFTTSPNENASKGQLSINQSGTAAWAAVLDGVFVLQNTNGTSATNAAAVMIDPNATNNVNGTNIVQYLVNNINATRGQSAFTSLGQILTVPQLTVNSPFLNYAQSGSLSDVAVERIPQQIMGLLRLGTPRYVIFAYGQALKPANGSIVTSGPYFGMCTNYQITGEMAARAVVRFDNFPVPGGAPTQPKAVIESYNVLPPE